jgi:hypothetical protein
MRVRHRDRRRPRGVRLGVVTSLVVLVVLVAPVGVHASAASDVVRFLSGVVVDTPDLAHAVDLSNPEDDITHTDALETGALVSNASDAAPAGTGTFGISWDQPASGGGTAPQSAQAAAVPTGPPSDCFGHAFKVFSKPGFLLEGRGQVLCMAGRAFISIKTCVAVKRSSFLIFSRYDDIGCTAFQDYFTKLTPLSIIDVPCERGTHKYKTHVHVKISRGSRQGSGSGFQAGNLNFKNCP